jgi:hypothetical protein
MKVEAVDFDHLAQHLPAVMIDELVQHLLKSDAMEGILGACGVHAPAINQTAAADKRTLILQPLKPLLASFQSDR